MSAKNSIISNNNVQTISKDDTSLEIDNIYHQFIDLYADLDLIQETYSEKTKLEFFLIFLIVLLNFYFSINDIL